MNKHIVAQSHHNLRGVFTNDAAGQRLPFLQMNLIGQKGATAQKTSHQPRDEQTVKCYFHTEKSITFGWRRIAEPYLKGSQTGNDFKNGIRSWIFGQKIISVHVMIV